MKTVFRYYYDTNCNKIGPDDFDHDPDDEDSKFHNVIAQNIIDSIPEYKTEYEEIRKHGFISTTTFLVMKGYIYIGGVEDGDMSSMFSSISLNDNTRDLLSEFIQDGYYVHDIIRNELKDEQKEQIKTWAKNGMDRKTIIHYVMTDMLTQLAPVKDKNCCEKEDFER